MPTIEQMAFVVLVDLLNRKAKKKGLNVKPDHLIASIPAQFERITKQEAK